MPSSRGGPAWRVCFSRGSAEGLFSLDPLSIRWTRRALQNLEQEAEFIARDDPDAAVLVVTRIHAALASLQSNPKLGRPGRVSGTRELVIPDTRYLIPYRVVGKQIQILRVFHCSRKWPAGPKLPRP